MESLYHHTNALILQAQQDFATWQSSTTYERDDENVQRLNLSIETIISNCRRLDVLAEKEPVQRRHNTKLRVDQLKYDCKHLQSAVLSMQQRRQLRKDEQLQREQLLSRRFTANSCSDTSIAIDAALQVNDRLQSSHTGVDSLLGVGGATLASLRDQRQLIKSARTRMLGLASTLGLSNTVMRLIERRSRQDKFVLFGGMLVSMFVMYMIWRYLG